jgi:diaminopimelate epimerase
MHGLGNDFVLIDALERPVSLSPAHIRFIADRRRGVGCDQVLVIEPARVPGTGFGYRIYNADGGEAEQCGNGARCVARYLRERGLIDGRRAELATTAGIIAVELHEGDQVTVDMGVPRLSPEQIPFIADMRAPTYRLVVEDREIEVSAVSMGNPHAVLLVDDVETAPVLTLGARIEAHARFPKRANVGFMQVLDSKTIRLRVYERGVGETPACGSGACAAVVAGHIRDLLGERVDVELPGGRLVISWRGPHTPVLMTGEAIKTFEGSIDL